MEKDIGRIQKRDDTDIVLRIDDFQDRRGFTIREFVTSDRYTGFTKAGVRILAKDWAKFKEMINSVEDADMKDPDTSGQQSITESTTPAETVPTEKPVEENTAVDY